MIPLAHLRRVLPLVVLATTGPARAAGAGFGAGNTALMTFTWEGAGPVGDLRTTKLVDSVSPAGAAGDMRLLLGAHTTLGVALAWNHFTGANQAIVNTLAPRLVAHWYLSQSRVQPYLGVGAGAVWTSTAVAGNPGQHAWGGCVDPQLGLLITVAQELALDLHVRYSYTTASTGSLNNYQWIAVGAGFGLY